ncbi:F-box domain-containing protein with Leucine-rich repeat [Orpheovirus IHUMI-LCC2]|uniref:F-box domain-containing protein with Leucine-rich repeat n=1 Tax=Orpheovirus IHUMI-LCC2 TaxID=2023057 RepID=A0A2I2L471_9VIRU|nr:F-box domain-containing protein with Leucine-rich repeat [Orpheovirus IHUMI-LCC2]SNW62336.1 F-box domain-containing protein with Leucine-rich repeat [Orpheovirus IHUMI-LCC2]
MSYNIPPEILLEILKYVRPKHLIPLQNISKDILGFTNTEFSQILEDKISKYGITKLSNKLKSFNVDINKFNDILKKYGAYVSGSFNLSCITGTISKSSDIDIYYYTPTHQQACPIEEELSQLTGSGLYPNMWMNYYLNGQGVEKYDHSCTSLNNIFSVHNLILKNNNRNLKIDIIALDIPPLQFINDNFDIDGCQIIYDGDKMYHQKHPLLKFATGNLHIIRLSNVSSNYSNLRSIRDCVMGIKNNIFTNKLSQKMFTYADYIDVPTDIPPPDALYTIYINSLNLMKKYRKEILDGQNGNELNEEDIEDVNEVKEKYNVDMQIDTKWLRIYRLLMRCLKYGSRGYKINNFNEYFQ